MKLYYSPGACSLSPHIALYASALPFEAIRVALSTHTLPDGTDYRTVQPLGYVPMLELDNGIALTEGPAIVQYIADQAAGKSLAPPNGTVARAQLQSWLNFISTEIHKGFSPLFSPSTPDSYKVIAIEKLHARLQWVDQQLASQPYLMGEHWNVADAYLFTVTNWASRVGVATDDLKHLNHFRSRMRTQPAVQQAMQAEGLAD